MGTVKCDACSIADAYVAAKKGRKVLVFCVHHAMQHMSALQSQGWTLLTKQKGGT